MVVDFPCPTIFPCKKGFLKAEHGEIVRALNGNNNTSPYLSLFGNPYLFQRKP